MQRTHCLFAALAVAVLGALPAQDEPARPAADPAAKAELAQALGRARVHNKRVLVVFADAGDDVLAKLQRDRALSRPLRYEFEPLQFAGAAADAMAVGLKFPAALASRPALLVLDQDGKQLANCEPADVVADGEVQGKALLGKLEPLFCAPVDAEKKFAAALVEAKKSGRNIFIRFDAPW